MINRPNKTHMMILRNDEAPREVYLLDYPGGVAEMYRNYSGGHHAGGYVLHHRSTSLSASPSALGGCRMVGGWCEQESFTVDLDADDTGMFSTPERCYELLEALVPEWWKKNPWDAAADAGKQ